MFSSWKQKNSSLTKEFIFNNFLEAIDFVNKVAKLSENIDHHPDIFIHSYKKVKIILTSHSEGKVTQKDYNLAKQIDELNPYFTQHSR